MKKKGKRLQDDKNIKKSNHRKKTIIQIIFPFIAVVLIIFATQYVFKEIDKQENIKQQDIETKEKEENVKNLSKSREYENMLIDNIQIYEEYGNIYFTAQIENKTKNKFKERDVFFNFLDEEEKSIIKFGYHIKEINSGEKIEIKIITNQDLTKAHDFKIEG